MTQQVFADFLQQSPATLSSIFNGRTRPTLQVIDAIKSKIPDISIEWLLYGQGMSRICTLPDDAKDILAAILKPYKGKPVLLDLWETTCGHCRLAFKAMHEKKKELAGRIHFVNIVSNASDLAVWLRLIPNYIGDHYRLTQQQLQSLHGQLPCDTSGVPIWVLINADGTIHHAFVGWSNVERMMREINPVLQ